MQMIKPMRLKAEPRNILFISSVVLFSVIVNPGYNVFYGDQIAYVPAIYKLVNPVLFKTDVQFYGGCEYTIFDDLIALILKLTGIDIFTAMFVISLITRSIIYYSIFRIARFFTSDNNYSLLFTLMFISGPIVITRFNDYLVPRMMSKAFVLGSFALLLHNKRLLSSVFLGLALITNALEATALTAYFYLELLTTMYKKRKVKIAEAAQFVIPVLLLGILFLTVDVRGVSLFTTVDPEWKDIILSRVPDIITRYDIGTWSYSSLLSFIPLIVFLLISVLEASSLFADDKRKRCYFTFILITMGLYAFSYVAIRIFDVFLIAKYQFHRSFFINNILIFSVFYYYCFRQLKEYPQDRIHMFSVFGLVFSFALKEYFIFTFYLFLPVFLFQYLKRNYGQFLDKIGVGFVDRERGSLSIYLFNLLVLTLGVILVQKYLGQEINTRYLMYVLVLNCICLCSVFAVSRIEAIGEKLGSIVPLLLVVACLIFIPRFSVLPTYFKDRPLCEATRWIRENTRPRDIVLTEPFSKNSGAVRMLGLRPVFTSRKMGGFGIFNRQYAFDWRERMSLVKQVSRNVKMVRRLLTDYGVGYIFSDSRLSVDCPLVFSNSKYYIYKITDICHSD